MSQNLYILGAEPGSGKSVIALAVMEAMSGHFDRVGFFRPLVPAGEPDALIELMRDRYALDFEDRLMHGCDSDTARELIGANRGEELLKRILAAYRELAAQCDAVLCVGTDFRDAVSALEFDFNTDIANNLDCPVLPVVNGHNRSDSALLDSTGAFLTSLRERDCEVLACIVNNVPADHCADLQPRLDQAFGQYADIHLVAANPELSQPTLANIAAELDAETLFTDSELLNHVVRDYKVAAMLIPDFLGYTENDSLIITPADRTDIILASLMAHHSSNYPRLAGLLLTGDIQPAEPLRRLLDGLEKPPFAILAVDSDTFSTALAVNRVRAAITADDEHRIAAALGTVEAGVDLQALVQSLAGRKRERVTPLMFEYDLLQRARQQPRHIVLPEGEEERILRAAERIRLRKVAQLTLLGNAATIRQRIDQLGLQLDDVAIIDPQDSALRQEFADCYFELRQHKGISREMAFDTLADVSYFGTLMVHTGRADGMVSGSVHTTQHTIRPAFEVIRTSPGTAIVSSVFLMCLADRVLVYGDCAVNPEPDAAQLADIAIASAGTAATFGIEPRIAMLSYSTGSSGKGSAVDKVREATALVREARPELAIEGPIQYDAAIDSGVARTKLPDSTVAGNATVFVFPDLNTGNNTYKAVQRSANAVAIGPVLQGLNKPVNDLSRGCTVTDIVNTIAITAVQAQSDGA